LLFVAVIVASALALVQVKAHFVTFSFFLLFWLLSGLSVFQCYSFHTHSHSHFHTHSHTFKCTCTQRARHA